MDLSKTGKLIAALRKEKGLTQKGLAEKLGISPKTVQYHISNVLARLKKLL